MLKVCKFGGSSVAGAEQFRKVRDIVLSDPSRRVVVISAAGKRTSDDHKLTDLLYLCHAHLTYGVACSDILAAIRSRFVSIRDELGLSYRVEDEFDAYAATLSRDTSVDELVSRGEYFTARLMAETLGYAFVDAADCVFFGFDGQFDRARTDAAIAAAMEKNGKIVLPGFYGRVPTGKIKVMTRGGSDITGALAAAAVNADVYENWTDVSGILMADPRIVNNPRPIPRITYAELREMAFMGASVLHEESILPVKEKGISLNIRNTNRPDDPGTFIVEHITLGLDSFALVVSSAALENTLYDVIADIQKTCRPDDVRVQDGIALVAAVGRKMPSRPGTSGKLFQALGEHGLNIRTIAQGADELSIIVGVENCDFEKAIRVLYDGFTG